MADLAATAATEFADYYEKVRADVHTWADALSQEQFWTKPYPYGNSVGHLVLHLTGNLSYYIGRCVAETGYVRDRDREFSDPYPPHKEAALAAFDKAVAMVVDRKSVV